jgi:hypothetical protein
MGGIKSLGTVARSIVREYPWYGRGVTEVTDPRQDRRGVITIDNRQKAATVGAAIYGGDTGGCCIWVNWE